MSRLLRRKQRAGHEFFDLVNSNPTRAAFDFPGEAILRAVADERSLIYRPEPLGSASGREAVAEYYADRGFPVDPQDVVLTCGTSEAYSYLFKILANPGDGVLIPRPSYPLFDFLARAEALRCRRYSLRYASGWSIDLGELEKLAARRARALVLVHPNNPTGSLVSPSEWAAIQPLSARLRLPVVCDEVFSDYLWTEDGGACFLEEGDALAFVLNGLSKVSALPQFKLGWILLRGPRRLKAAARRRLEIVADTFLSVAAPVQMAARDLLRVRRVVQPQIRLRLSANLDFLKRAAAGTAVDVLEAQAGWQATLRLPRTRSEERWALDFLERRGTLVHPGRFYNFSEEAYVALSLLVEEEVFQAGVRAVLEEVESGPAA